MNRFLCVGVIGLLCLTLTGVAQAQPPAAKDPLQRLVTRLPDSGDGGKNTEVHEADIESLPDYVRHQATLAASCTGNAQNISQIKSYSYVSDRNRKQKLGPNYILDLSGLSAHPFTNCMLGELCKNGQCALIGYAADRNGWHGSFLEMMTAWTVEAVAGPNGTAPTAYIRIASVSENDCEAEGGEAKNDVCVKNYVWQDAGLSQK